MYTNNILGLSPYRICCSPIVSGESYRSLGVTYLPYTSILFVFLYSTKGSYTRESLLSFSNNCVISIASLSDSNRLGNSLSNNSLIVLSISPSLSSKLELGIVSSSLTISHPSRVLLLSTYLSIAVTVRVFPFLHS